MALSEQNSPKGPGFLIHYFKPFTMQTFPRFMEPPPELRIQIWQDARPKPAIHVFDVRIPTCPPTHTKEAIERFRLARHKSDIVGQVFLDQIIVSRPKTPLSVETDTETDSQQNAYCSIESAFPFDPSTYLVTDSIQQSCREADLALEFPTPLFKQGKCDGFQFSTPPSTRARQMDLVRQQHRRVVSSIRVPAPHGVRLGRPQSHYQQLLLYRGIQKQLVGHFETQMKPTVCFDAQESSSRGAWCYRD